MFPLHGGTERCTRAREGKVLGAVPAETVLCEHLGLDTSKVSLSLISSPGTERPPSRRGALISFLLSRTGVSKLFLRGPDNKNFRVFFFPLVIQFLL